ncbi:flagellar protein FliS [Sphingomonas floccifaciens]|uniref:Flagellar protein FliS n=1 Tax=Sphingomonas floccifaciens TaxID=1844115 RepID=A0ABW4NBC6_9SPHN
MARYSTAFASPEATYRSVDMASRVGSEDAAGLVALLYAECSRALRSAAWAAENHRYDVKSERVTRAIAILFALEAGLDFDAGGDLSYTLARMYQGARKQVTDASLGLDPKPFLMVAETLDEIAGAWNSVRRA